jgi:hypothetical protein
MYQINIPSITTKLFAVILILAVAGCAIYRHQKSVEMKRLLTASGFRLRVADNESKLAQLKELPQRRLVAQNWDGRVSYVFADAKVCKCAYVGDKEAYQRFQDLAHKKRIAEEDRRAAERNRVDDLDWGGWRFEESW